MFLESSKPSRLTDIVYAVYAATTRKIAGPPGHAEMACNADTLSLAAAESTPFLDHFAVLDPVAGKSYHVVEHIQWIEPTNLELDFPIDER
jgi:hypothetical protein